MKVYNNYKIIDSKLFLYDGGRFYNKSVAQENQTTNRIANYLKISNSCIENSGFPNFMEMIR